MWPRWVLEREKMGALGLGCLRGGEKGAVGLGVLKGIFKVI
jgi:hypothetical protein